MIYAEQTDSIFDSEADAAVDDHKMDGMESASLGIDMGIASDFGSSVKVALVGEVDEDANTGTGAVGAAAAAVADAEQKADAQEPGPVAA